jgi:hypothetical protein
VGLWVLAEHAAGRSKEEEKNYIFPRDFVVLFLFFNMKRRRFGQNAPFHLNKIWCQNTSTSKSVLNLSFVHLSP